jgi:nitroreductase
MTITAMDFEDVIRKRKMVRKFKRNRPISDRMIVKLIRNAHRAPSAGHTQVQEFIIVKDPLISSCRPRICRGDRYGIRGRDFYSIIDGAFASMLILLTTVNEGIGACFVGAFEDDKVSKILEIPEQVRPIGIICVGYSDEEPERIERIPLSELVYYNKYGYTSDKM